MRWPWSACSLNTDHVKHDGVVFAGYLHGDSRLVVPDGSDVLPPTRDQPESQPDLPSLRAPAQLSGGWRRYSIPLEKGQRSGSPMKHDRSPVPVLGEDSDKRNSDEDVVGVVVLEAKRYAHTYHHHM